MSSAIWIASAFFLGAQPLITNQLLSQVKAPGTIARFTVAAVGSGPMSYEWLRNGQKIPGAGGHSLRIPAVSSRAGTYAVKVRDATGETLSEPATLQVRPRPKVLVQPRSTLVVEHGTAVFNVVLNNSGPYQQIIWHNANPLEGSHEIPEGIGLDVHNPHFEIPDVNNTDPYNGLYWLAVTNETGGIVSRKVVLTVVPAPQVLVQPRDLTLGVGMKAVLSFVLAPDHAPKHRYQWYKNGTPIRGATSSRLIIPAVRTSHEAFYWCDISTMAGTTTTGSAYLQVIQ